MIRRRAETERRPTKDQRLEVQPLGSSRVRLPALLHSYYSPILETKNARSHESFWRFRSAGWTGLEPAASGVTGRRYNQLNYHPSLQQRLDFVGGTGFEPVALGL